MGALELKIVFATTSLPHGRCNGGEIASMNFIDALVALGNIVHVVGYNRLDSAPIEAEYLHSAGPWPIEMADAGLQRYEWLLRAVASGRPFTNSKFMSKAYRRALFSAEPANADLLLLDHAHMGWIDELPNLPASRIFVAHNVESDLYGAVGRRNRGLKGWIYDREGRLLKQLERDLVVGNDQTWCLSKSDGAALAKLGGAPKKIKILDIPGQPLPAPAKSVDAIYDFGLIGSWNWEVNREGMVWFLEEVMQHLPEGMKVAIAGSGSEALGASDPRIIILGRVPDAGEFMRQCRVLAVPTLVGSGIQLKTIEGIAVGVSLVTTQLGIRGISDAPRHVHVADGAREFAEALCAARDCPLPTSAVGKTWADARRNRFRESVAAALDAIPNRKVESDA